MSIPVFKPSIRRRDMHSVLSCLVTDQIGPATQAEELVDHVGRYLERSGGYAFREYRRAVEVVVSALGLVRGDGVVLSPLAPRVYLRVFDERGIVPMFADVLEEDACADPDEVMTKIADGAKAVFLHAPLGRIPRIEGHPEWGVPLVEDIGESLGANDTSGPVGSRGNYTILPMESHGVVTSGGGTLVLAGGKPEKNLLDKAAAALTGDVYLPDLNASLGLVQFRELEKTLEIRMGIEALFRQALAKGRHRTLSDAEEGNAIPYSFPVVLKVGMNEVRRYARKKGIETEAAFVDCAYDPAAEEDGGCPRARNLMMSSVLFPLYPTLGKKNVHQIVKVLSTLP